MAGREVVNRQVNVYIQSGDAQKALDVLTAKQKKWTDEIRNTTDPKRIQQLKDNISKLIEPIDRATKKVKGELEPSFKDTESTVNRLRNSLRRMSESDADFTKVTGQYKQANKELEQQRGKIGLISKAWKSFWTEAKTVAVGVIIGNTIQSALQTVLGYFTGIITGSAKIADELSDIEKTTGLTNAQVRELNKELGKIDTRTSRSELRKLAVEGGKLGKETVEDIRKFVNEADKIKIALKEDLGEGAILDIAKTSQIFQVEMLNMASAINQVGASSSASEAFSVDFLKRTGGIAATAKIAAGDVLGYSSAIEQAGLTAEVSTTALNTFFIDFVSGTEKFGKAAGFAKGELSKIVKEQGTNEGFLQFLTRLKAANPDAASFINKLKELGIDGARGSNVMLTLANNIGEVREQQLIANKAIASSDSIMNEFNKKNNNAAANLDKLKKEIAGLFQSESFQQAGEKVISIMRGFVDLIKSSAAFVKEHGGLIATLGIIYAVFTIKIKSASLAQVAWNIVTAAGRVITKAAQAAVIAYEVVMGVIAGRLTVARGAQLLWNGAMALGAGPLGIIIVAVGALAIGLGKLFSRTKELTAAQKLQAELSQKIADATGDEVANIEAKVKVANDETASLNNRNTAILELIRINPEFEKTLKINTQGHLEGKEAIDAYVKALKIKAEAEANASLLTDKIKKKNDLINNIRTNSLGDPKVTDEQIVAQLRAALEERAKKLVVKIGSASADIKLTGGVSAKELLQTIDQIDSLTDSVGKAAVELDKIKGTNPPIPDPTPTATAIDKTKDKLAELLADLQKIKDELRLSQLSPFDKELAALDIKFNALRERAKGNNKQLIIVEELYQASRFQLVKEFAAKEVAEWKKAGDDGLKAADEAFKKNLEALQKIQKNLEDVGNEAAGDRTVNFERRKELEFELELQKAHGKKKLKLILDDLARQEQSEINAADKIGNEVELIQEKYRRKRKEAELDNIISIIEKTAFFAQQLLNIGQIFADAKTEKENRELENDRLANEQKKKNLDNRLKAGTVSQQQYDREVQKLERDQEKREKAARIKQFERDKRAKAVQAGINLAGAVTTTLEKFGPPLPPNFLGIAAMALTLITGIAQIATISNSKPPAFARGGKLGGRSHAAGGNPIYDGATGQQIAEIEKEEGILNKFSMRDKKVYTMRGTLSQIGSTANGLHRGRTWDTPAKLEAGWSNHQPVPFNFSAIRKYYATGGKFESNATAPAGQSDEINSTLMFLGNAIVNLERRLSQPIISHTVLSEHQIAADRLAAIKADATLK